MYKQAIETILKSSGLLLPQDLQSSLHTHFQQLEGIQPKSPAIQRLIGWYKRQNPLPTEDKPETMSPYLQHHIADQLAKLLLNESQAPKLNAIYAAYQLYASAGVQANSDTFDGIFDTLLGTQAKTRRQQYSPISGVFNIILSQFLSDEKEQISEQNFAYVTAYLQLLKINTSAELDAWKSNIPPQMKTLKNKIRYWESPISKHLENAQFNDFQQLKKDHILHLQCRTLSQICKHPNFAPSPLTASLLLTSDDYANNSNNHHVSTAVSSTSMTTSIANSIANSK